jgi:transposase
MLYMDFRELGTGEVRRISLLELFAMILGCAASCKDERLLRRPAQKDSGGRRERDAHDRGRPHLLKVGVSSVKRYMATYREGRSLVPKKRPGSKPKLDESARKLLEANLKEHPEATLPQRREFLRRVRGVEVSDSTVSRVLKRMGWSRKKDRWVRARETNF